MNGGAPRALVICGPTASGKSNVALGVAELLGGEIVNADSRQVYRGMCIGTGVPPARLRRGVAHHLYAFLDPKDRYSAARYAADALAAIADIGARGKLPIVVGGTGFYIEALLGTMPLDRPPPDDNLRSRLRREAATHPADVLWEWLRVRSPAIAAVTGPRDRYRIVRGLERALCKHREGGKLARPPAIRAAVACLTLSKPDLSQRVEHRVAEMFAAGIVDEAVAVRAAAPDAPALSGLGYAESLALWDGLADRREAIASTVKRTMQYAKRQQTWFRRMRDAAVIDARVEADAIAAFAALARERLTPA